MHSFKLIYRILFNDIKLNILDFEDLIGILAIDSQDSYKHSIVIY